MSMLSSFMSKHFFDMLMKELVQHEPAIQAIILRLIDAAVEHFSKAIKDKIEEHEDL